MARVNLIKSSFSAGEISPLLYGRTELEVYNKAVETLDNMIVLPQGIITKRPGTVFVKEVKDSTARTILIPFQFSTTQAYIIEAGNLYFRFYRNNAVITEATVAITGITKANPGVVTAVAHGFSNGNEVYITGVVGMTQVNGRFFTVANVAADTFELSGVDTTTYTTYVSGGTVARVYTIVSPYTSAQLDGLQWTQSADKLYITHNAVAPQILTRTAHTSWTIGAAAFTEPPWLPENSTVVTLTPAATTGAGVNVTASAATFAATDVGRSIWIIQGAARGYATITAYTSTTVVVVTIVDDFGATTASARWAMSAFSSTLGYPSCVAFYQDRLIFANTTTSPQRIWFSEQSAYLSFGGSDTLTEATDGFTRELNSDQVNAIRWLSPQKTLLVGTTGEEFNISASSLNEAITPTNVRATPETNKGSYAIKPVRIDADTVFLQKTGAKLLTMSYSFEADRNITSDLSVFAEHLLHESPLRDVVYQREPYSVLWARRNDGVLLGCTYVKEQQLLAWHKHTIGGTSVSVKSLAVIEGTHEDQLWMIVSRTINSTTKQYIEYLSPSFRETDVEDSVFLDSSLSRDSTPTTSLTNLRHLIGQSLGILADGAQLPNATVSATGGLTLSLSSSIVTVGLEYDAKMRTLAIDPPFEQGSSQTSMGRIHQIGVRLFETVGLEFGYDFDDMIELPFRDQSDVMDDPIPLFSGIKLFKFNKGVTREMRVALRNGYPLPWTLTGLVAYLTVNPT